MTYWTIFVTQVSGKLLPSTVSGFPRARDLHPGGPWNTWSQGVRRACWGPSAPCVLNPHSAFSAPQFGVNMSRSGNERDLHHEGNPVSVEALATESLDAGQAG